jgi:hypothetical protein
MQAPHHDAKYFRTNGQSTGELDVVRLPGRERRLEMTEFSHSEGMTEFGSE